MREINTPDLERFLRSPEARKMIPAVGKFWDAVDDARKSQKQILIFLVLAAVVIGKMHQQSNQ